MAHLLALCNNQRAGLYAKAPVGVGQIRVILFTFPEAHQVEPGNVRSRASQKPLSLSTAHVAASSSCCAKIRVRTPARAETEGEERTRESHRMQSGGRKHACRTRESHRMQSGGRKHALLLWIGIGWRCQPKQAAATRTGVNISGSMRPSSRIARACWLIGWKDDPAASPPIVIDRVLRGRLVWTEARNAASTHQFLS
jgi:hypothetical protein